MTESPGRSAQLARCLLIAIALSSCRATGESKGAGVPVAAGSGGPVQVPESRVIRPQVWDTTLIAGASESDTSLIDPFVIAALHDTVVVFDYGRGALLAFDGVGRRLWRFGRKGRGPGEFDQVRDVKATPVGNLSVLDAGRVTIIGPDGSLRRIVTLVGAPHADQHLPMPHGVTLLATLDAPGTLASFDSTGRALDRRDVPWPEFAGLEPIERQGLLARDQNSDRSVYLLVVGDGWFAYQGDSLLPFTGHYVEHHDFPSLTITTRKSAGTESRSVFIPREAYGAAGAVLQDSVVVVLFEGTTSETGRLLDYYLWSSGQYLGSMLLPFKTMSIASGRGRDLFVLFTEPHPRVMRLHPQ